MLEMEDNEPSPGSSPGSVTSTGASFPRQVAPLDEHESKVGTTPPGRASTATIGAPPPFDNPTEDSVRTSREIQAISVREAAP